MSKHKPEKVFVGVARCERCPDIHLVVLGDGDVIASIAMDREEWARLIGNYGEMLAAGGPLNNERKH